VIVPPVRSSSHTEASGAIFGRPLGQRSDSQNSLFAYEKYGFNKPTYSRSNSASAELNAVTSALSIVSRHAREGATTSPTDTEPAKTSHATPSNIDTTDAHFGAPHAVDTGMVATPPLSRPISAEGPRDVNNGPRPQFGHQRSSSDMLALASERQRPSIGDHRRSSSTELSDKALPARPVHGRQHRSSTSALQDKQSERQYMLETARTAALLIRNKPLPAAAVIREEIRACRSAGERAVVYARKINELSTVDSGLLAWLSRTRPTGMCAKGECPSDQAKTCQFQSRLPTMCSGLSVARVQQQCISHQRAAIQTIHFEMTTSQRLCSRFVEEVRMYTKQGTLLNELLPLLQVRWSPIIYHIRVSMKTRRPCGRLRRCRLTRKCNTLVHRSPPLLLLRLVCPVSDSSVLEGKAANEPSQLAITRRLTVQQDYQYPVRCSRYPWSIRPNLAHVRFR
jgi:hypothetical protein